MRLLTNDLYEGAWLLSKGLELRDLWVSENAKRSIVFEFIGNELGGLKEEYKKGKAQANVLALKRSINELKDQMFLLLRDKERSTENMRLRGENHVRSFEEIHQR